MSSPSPTSDWNSYIERVQEWRACRSSAPGFFCDTTPEHMWQLCCAVPIPATRPFPVLALPLCLHLARGPELGCDLSFDDCEKEILPGMNAFWNQAGIRWDLIQVKTIEWPDDPDGTRQSLENAKRSVWSLQRDEFSGMMMNKDHRKKLFLEQLLPQAERDLATFDVYIFDFIGHESQGCCISRDTHTVIMGVRSTKGYPEPTRRPLHCLAKTCAHELGHALGLDHPRGQRFSDGTARTVSHGRNNLMSGGKDSMGGGGEMLEDWQILAARCHGELHLQKFAI